MIRPTPTESVTAISRRLSRRSRRVRSRRLAGYSSSQPGTWTLTTTSSGCSSVCQERLSSSTGVTVSGVIPPIRRRSTVAASTAESAAPRRAVSAMDLSGLRPAAHRCDRQKLHLPNHRRTTSPNGGTHQNLGRRTSTRRASRSRRTEQYHEKTAGPSANFADFVRSSGRGNAILLNSEPWHTLSLSAPLRLQLEVRWSLRVSGQRKTWGAPYSLSPESIGISMRISASASPWIRPLR